MNGQNIISNIDGNNISLKEVASGQVARNIEEGYAKNFISRDILMKFSENMNVLKGKSDTIQIVDTTGINVANDWESESSKLDVGEITTDLIDKKYPAYLMAFNLRIKIGNYCTLQYIN